MSRSRSSRSSTTSFSGHSYGGLGRLVEEEQNFAAAYGEPAFSDASSDAQIARAISESKRTAQGRSPTVSRTNSYASTSSSSTLLGSDSGSSRSSSSTVSYTPSYAPSPRAHHSPTPTPRYAADEIIARNLAHSWDVASVQSDIIANPQYARSIGTPSGPPLVVRTSSPSPSTRSIASSTAFAHQSPTPSRPLSPLVLPTRLRTPSVRSMASNSSIRSSASAHSVSSAASVSTTRSSSSRASGQSIQSVSSLLSSVTRSARHAPLHTAAQTLRASLPPSLSRSASSASVSSSASARLTTPRGSARASSVRSASTAASSRRSSARANETETENQVEAEALARLHFLATSPVRCTNPACGTLIPPMSFSSINFPNTNNNAADPTALPPPPPALLMALHARCPACTTTHCRGCGFATWCNGCVGASTALVHVSSPARSNKSAGVSSPYTAYAPNANGNAFLAPQPSCPIPTHCPAARALGALAALIAFDRAHLAALGPQQTPSRAADKPLLGPLHALVFFLSPPTTEVKTPPSEGAGLLLKAPGSINDYDNDGEPPEAHPALPTLLALSRVLGYAAGLLRAGLGAGGRDVDVGTWMSRAPAFGAMLSFLRAVGDVPGLRGLLTGPIPTPTPTLRVEAWLYSSATSSWRSSVRAGAGEGDTLLPLIRRLDPTRAALLRLAGATRFGPTVEKAHALCDGVLYLLLQDVLGEET